ncbi:MAG: 4Fe-4S binding protein [Chitinophagales bacterium]
MSDRSHKSLSFVDAYHEPLSPSQKASLAIVGVGFLILLLALFGVNIHPKIYFLVLSVFSISVGSVLFSMATYKNGTEGIKNNGVFFKSLTSGGIIGWMAAIIITGFYVILYWFPQYLGFLEEGNKGLIALFDPLSRFIKGQPASQWFVYGVFYTIAILLMGVKFIYKYRHNKYQIIRTLSVMFFQLAFAFLLPEILEALNSDKAYFAKDLKNIWPLNYYFFEDWHLNNMLDGGFLGRTMLAWGILLIIVVSPVLTYFYGKRWYCSWVCGCGGLAETAGDPFRQLSDKSNESWQIERIIIYSVLFLIALSTGLLLYTRFSGHDLYFKTNKFYAYGGLVLLGAFLFFLQRRFYPFVPPKRIRILIPSILAALIAGFEWKFTQGSFIQFNTSNLSQWYGFFIGAAFSGVIGVGFYPIMGSRVWCRFGCPQAAILGLFQKYFSRFRITTNGGQCISCGNCSTYCEMGIDVRSYAQKGQNVVRASCVGCGICAAVCPRGVLKLENGPEIQSKTDIQPVIITREEVNILR